MRTELGQKKCASIILDVCSASHIHYSVYGDTMVFLQCGKKMNADQLYESLHPELKRGYSRNCFDAGIKYLVSEKGILVDEE